MDGAYDLPGNIADVAHVLGAADNVGIDPEHIDSVAPVLIFAGKIFHREGNTARVILLDQAVLMECPWLDLAGALVARVLTDDMRIAG